MIRSLLLCGLLLAGAGVATAQGSAPAQDELLALNFYVQQKDQPAIEAELRRLQLKYPDWQPPQDLSRLAITTPTTEIDEIFRLIAASRYEEARALIAATRLEFPDWQPPADMVTLLDTAEGQGRFDTALQAGNLNQALSVVSSVPGLLRCDRINNAWRIAEAQAAAGREAEALGTYRAVAATCVSPGDLIATLEKADVVATEAEIVALIAEVGQRLPAMDPELAGLRSRLMAGRGHPPEKIPGATGVASTAKPGERVATRRETTPAAPGTVTATRKSTGSGPASGAAPVASGSSSAGGGGTGGASFQAAANAGDWSRCLALSAGSRVVSVLYQRGWCAYNLNQSMEAVASFNAALSGGLKGEQRRDAAYGIALAYLKMGLSEEASRIAAATDFTHKQRVDIERQILDQRGVSAYKRKQYRQAIAYFDALEQLTGGIRRDLAVLRAYSLLNMGNRVEARREFQRLNHELSTNDTRRGLAATNE